MDGESHLVYACAALPAEREVMVGTPTPSRRPHGWSSPKDSTFFLSQLPNYIYCRGAGSDNFQGFKDEDEKTNSF